MKHKGTGSLANIVMAGAFFVMSAELWSEVEGLRPIVVLRTEVKKGMRCKIEEKGGTRYVKIVFP